jgi:hypothetical protein
LVEMVREEIGGMERNYFKAWEADGHASE